MTLFPRSLLWRTVLLLAVLMVAGHFASLEIFRAAEREPRAVQIAQQIASVVNLTRSALITADSAKRLDLLRDLSQQEGIQVYADAPNEPVEALPDRPITRLITLELQRRLGPDTQLLGTSDSMHGVWVSFKIDDLEYWVRLSRERIERAEQLRWIGWGALILLLSVIGAFAIVARINRPLRELTRAATAIGRGDVPPPVVETGPAEVRTLSRAFNQMATDLQRADADRALLLAGVSHDLRTPLSRIRLGVEMLDDKTDAVLREGMVQDVEDIDAVINQFLDFARVTGEPGSGGELDLNELVHSVVDRYVRQGKQVSARTSPVPVLAGQGSSAQPNPAHQAHKAHTGLLRRAGSADVPRSRDDSSWWQNTGVCPRRPRRSACVDCAVHVAVCPVRAAAPWGSSQSQVAPCAGSAVPVLPGLDTGNLKA